MSETYDRHIQTLARAYSAICSGTLPWVALNEFLHEWFDYSSEQRERLVADPIPYARSRTPLAFRSHRAVNQLAGQCEAHEAIAAVEALSTATAPDGVHHNRDAQRIPHQLDALDPWRWAVFCAGAADYLCQRFDVPRPSWIDDPRFTLSEPWYGFGDPGAAHPEVRAHLERTTPEPLRRRNVLSGDRVFANKHEATVAALDRMRHEAM